MSALMSTTPRDARIRVAWEEALLVCCDEADRFQRAHPFGAISLRDFMFRMPNVAKDQELIFYSVEPDGAAATSRVTEYRQQGYTNATVMVGGLKAWSEAGYPVCHNTAKKTAQLERLIASAMCRGDCVPTAAPDSTVFMTGLQDVNTRQRLCDEGRTTMATRLLRRGLLP